MGVGQKGDMSATMRDRWQENAQTSSNVCPKSAKKCACYNAQKEVYKGMAHMLPAVR